MSFITALCASHRNDPARNRDNHQRTLHSDTDEIGSTALLNEQLYVKVWHMEDEDVIKLMRILANRENGPHLLHCRFGSDQSDVRNVPHHIQGWTQEEAIDEMVNGGYGFDQQWTRIIHCIQPADTGKLKKTIPAK